MSLSYMAVKLHNHHSLVSSRSSNPWFSRNSVKSCICCRTVLALDCGNSTKRYPLRIAMLENGKNNHLVSYWKNFGNFCRSRRNGHLLLHASSDDGVTLNGSPQANTSSNVEERGKV